MALIRETSDGVSFAVKVHPRAKKNAITGEIGDALKISLTAPPTEGRANEACIAFLGDLLNVPRSDCRRKRRMGPQAATSLSDSASCVGTNGCRELD
jgi:uncharacterized protein (TIGR00251 family)